MYIYIYIYVFVSFPTAHESEWGGMEWMHFEHFGSFCSLLVICLSNTRNIEMSGSFQRSISDSFKFLISCSLFVILFVNKNTQHRNVRVLSAQRIRLVSIIVFSAPPQMLLILTRDNS